MRECFTNTDLFFLGKTHFLLVIINVLILSRHIKKRREISDRLIVYMKHFLKIPTDRFVRLFAVNTFSVIKNSPDCSPHCTWNVADLLTGDTFF